jgi:hypothetical protein
MAFDVMQIEILEDGTIKTTTDPISGANHQNAEEFLRFVARMAGGETTRTRRTDAHHHSHSHSHSHSHEHTHEHTHEEQKG